ncbi:MAG: hypothetical protein ACREL3_00345 [Gemmatimonadales bacterium]
MSDHRSAARRASILVVILGAASGTAAIRGGGVHSTASSSISPADAALPDTLVFDVSYGGIGAEGVDQIWHGVVGGPVPGRVTIRMEYAGAPGDSRMPLWPVNAWLFFSADDYRNSFCAELSGSMSWKSGDMRVTGLVSNGVHRDTPIEQRIHFRLPTLAGTAMVRFLPRLATRSGASGNN